MNHLDKVYDVLGLVGGKVGKRAKRAVERVASRVPEAAENSDFADSVRNAIESDSYFIKKDLRREQRKLLGIQDPYETSSSDDETTDLNSIADKRLKSLERRLNRLFEEFLNEIDDEFDELVKDLGEIPSKHTERAIKAFEKEKKKLLDDLDDSWKEHYKTAEKEVRHHLTGGLLLSDTVAVVQTPAVLVGDLAGSVIKSTVGTLREVLNEQTQKAFRGLKNFTDEHHKNITSELSKNANELKLLLQRTT